MEGALAIRNPMEKKSKLVQISVIEIRKENTLGVDHTKFVEFKFS